MKNLKLKDGVEVTDTIVRTINILDNYFVNEPSIISSGFRTADHQFGLIKNKVKELGIDKLFHEYAMMEGNDFNLKLKLDGLEIYWWQRAWSKLLNIGFIINPPVPAEILLDYIDPKTKINKKGRVIDISNHMKGNAFDIEGNNSISQKETCTKKAIEVGDCFIHGYRKEDINNAIHIDCEVLT